MEIKPSLAIAIATVFLLVGGAAAWFTFQGTSHLGPGDVGVDRSGRLHAHFGDRIFSFGEGGLPEPTTQLSDVGAVGIWGGLSFYPNGDWLIAPEGTEEDGRLHRCRPGSMLHCDLLPAFNKYFRRTFRTHINDNSRFYLSDSAAGTLSLHGSQGELLSNFDVALKHPGEVKRYGELLAIADVDGFKMRVFSVDPATGENLGEHLSFRTLGDKLSETFINQPVDFFLYEDIWHVLVKDVSMSHARLRRYDQSGNYLGDIPLPETRMIMAMERHGDTIVLSDYRLKRLLRVGLEGQPLPDLESQGWRDYKNAVEAGRQQNLFMGYSLWGLFALLLIAGFAIAIVQQRKIQQQEQQLSEAEVGDQCETPPPTVHDPAIVWLKHSRTLGLMSGLIVVSLLGLALMPALLPAASEQSCESEALSIMMFGLCAGFAALMLPVLLMFRRTRKMRLGVRDEWIIAQSPDGSVARSRAPDLHHMREMVLYVEAMRVYMGPPNMRLYDKQQFSTHVEPLLQQAKALTGLESYRWRWQHDRRGVVVEVVATLAAVFVAAIILLNGGEAYFDQLLDSIIKSCEEGGPASSDGSL